VKLRIIGAGCLALTLVGATCSQAVTDNVASLQPNRECTALPAELPRGAMIDYSRDDYEHNVVHHMAFVVDAPCPEPELLPVPQCVRVSREVLQAMWTELRKMEVHRIEMVDREGQCPHCGGPWITVEWPDGRCSAGEGYAWDIAADSQDRYYEIARFLDRVCEVVEKKMGR
jgi:hypothetical protein